MYRYRINYNTLFQFTQPVWGATESEGVSLEGVNPFQFTHPVWGATISVFIITRHIAVSIHAPRVGCDFNIRYKASNNWFQFTHPVWGATYFGLATSNGDVFQFTHPVWGATSRGHANQ